MSNNVTDKKWANVLAYILFFIPLIFNAGSETGKFHANQGLNLFLLSIAVSIVGSIIPAVGFIILQAGNIVVLVLCVMGILNAINDRMKPLPIIGNFTLIK